jgi:hypothetical protein
MRIEPILLLSKHPAGVFYPARAQPRERMVVLIINASLFLLDGTDQGIEERG